MLDDDWSNYSKGRADSTQRLCHFNAEKAKLYVELAEQVKGINQMHSISSLRLDAKSTIPMNWIELKSLRWRQYLQLLLQVDVVKALSKKHEA